MKLRFLQKWVLVLPVLFILLFASSAGITAANVQTDSIGTDDVKLTVATRHDSTIYQKYAAAFAQSDLGKSVGIEDSGDIEFVAPTTYDAISRAVTNEAIQASIIWGGGPTLFNNLGDDGILASITDQDLVDYIDANISDTIAGAEMKSYNDDEQLEWVAAAISSFGFTVNHDVLEERGLDVPRSWEDLASPDFFTSNSEFNIGMGNAPDTTSNTRIYQIILQNYGWEKGWEIIYSMAGNSKIYGGSVETRSSVINGATAAAMTIDFYGVIAMSENPATEYIIPEGASIVNGDPIALAKNASTYDNYNIAKAFFKFVLSDEGQSLWMDNRINRLPVREDAFTAAEDRISEDEYFTQEQINSIESLYNQTLANQGIAFDEGLALSLEEAMRYHFESTITQVHSNLREAWSSIVGAYKNGNLTETQFQENVTKFGSPLITLAEAQDINDQIIEDVDFRLEKQSAWENEANDKYRQFIAENSDVQDFPINSFYSVMALFLLVPITKIFRKQE